MLFTDFPNMYDIIVNPELPGTGKWSIPELYVPQDFKPKAIGGHLILKVKIGQQWQVWSDENSQVWTAPDPNRILIAGMEGMLYVPVQNPADSIRLKSYDLQVRAVKEHGLLLLNGYFSLMALDSSGIRWQTPELVSDNMTIEAIDGNKIICSGFSLSNINEKVKVILDISTGAILEDTTKPPKKSPLQRFLGHLPNISKGQK